jgi:hypothetical protein
MTLVIKLTAVFIVMIGSMVTTTRVVSGLTSSHIDLLIDPLKCPQPCWHGVRPNESTLPGAIALLSRDSALRMETPTEDSLCWSLPSGPFERGCAFTFQKMGNQSGKIQLINLIAHENAFLLGDAIRLFGEPIASIMCEPGPANIYFKGSIMVITASYSPRFDPHMQVSNLAYLSADQAWYEPQTPLWRGFHGRRNDKHCVTW